MIELVSVNCVRYNTNWTGEWSRNEKKILSEWNEMVSRDLFLHCAENTVSNCMHTIHFTSSNRATFKSSKKMTKKKMTVKTTAITSKLWRQINNLCVCRFVNVLIKMWMKWKRASQRVLAKAVHNMKSFRRLSLYWNIFNYILVRHKENLFRLFKWRCFHENDLHCIVCCERQAIFQHYYRVCRNL